MSEWQRAAHCANGSCVEVQQARWHKATFCSGGQCVEVAEVGSSILIRNSNRPDQVLAFTHEEWDVFVKGVKNGEFRF